MYKMMTAGPTQLAENTRMARSLEFPNPDMDPGFFDLYKDICGKLSDALHTENEALILGGEGILGLEAACASLTEPGDRVLVIDNGIFGKGFADFVNIYGGKPVFYTSDYHRPVDVDDLKAFLEKDSDFKYATVVHCDTPSGVLNDVEKISRLLDQYDIPTVADSVAGMFGEPLDLENSSIDILCGGSQKALSAAPGLTMLWVSERAYRIMESRTVPISSFYANILSYRGYYEKQWFPYTMPASDIISLGTALDNFLDDPQAVFDRHAKVAGAVRSALRAGGIDLYLDSGFSNTVTVFNVPRGTSDRAILDGLLKNHDIMISGCFDVLAGKVLRIGHMGENCYPEKVCEVLSALQDVLSKNGIPLDADLAGVFREKL